MMAVINRKIKESPLYQGEDEEVVYTLTTTPWGGSPQSTGVTVVVKKNDNSVDTNATSGSPSVSGDDISSPTILNLSSGHTYRLEFLWLDAGDQKLEAWSELVGEE